jgi:hypothetical protein
MRQEFHLPAGSQGLLAGLQEQVLRADFESRLRKYIQKVHSKKSESRLRKYIQKAQWKGRAGTWNRHIYSLIIWPSAIRGKL